MADAAREEEGGTTVARERLGAYLGAGRCPRRAIAKVDRLDGPQAGAFAAAARRLRAVDPIRAVILRVVTAASAMGQYPEREDLLLSYLLAQSSIPSPRRNLPCVL